MARAKRGRTLIERLEPRALLSVSGQLVSPATGSITNANLGYVDIQWNDSTGSGIRAQTIDTRDITINGNRPTGVSQLSPSVYRYTYSAPLSQGSNSVEIIEGQVKNNNNESNSYSFWSFTYDSIG